MLDTVTENEQNLLDDELYKTIISTINGKYYTRNEVSGYYQMGILRDGVTL